MTPLEAALGYAARGWAVLPLHNPGAAGCSCREPDCSSPAKHPRTAHGLSDASADPDQVRRWFVRWPQANVGVRTGAVSGLVVIDVDPDHGGVASMAELARTRGEVSSVARVATGGGGAHLYFGHPGQQVPNDTGRRLGAGIDVRGDGGYVVAPPSVHASGLRYGWSGEVEKVPALPGWLEDALIRRLPVPRREPEVLVHHTSAWADAALRGEVASVSDAAAGTRNSTLNRAAFRLGQLVGAGLLDERSVWSELEVAAAGVGLAESERLRTISSGLDAGRGAPRWREPGRSSAIDDFQAEIS